VRKESNKNDLFCAEYSLANKDTISMRAEKTATSGLMEVSLALMPEVVLASPVSQRLWSLMMFQQLTANIHN